MGIEDWVYTRFHSARPTSNGQDIIVRCPFCMGRVGSPDTSGHLYIAIANNVSHCFRCGYRADWIKLVADVDGCSFREARYELNETFTPLYRLINRVKDDKARYVEEMPKTFVTISNALESISPMLQQYGTVCKCYVKYRISKVPRWEEYLDIWGVWDSSDALYQLVLPVERGWWQVRNIDPAGVVAKYVSTSAPKEDRLYNWQCLGMKRVYIAEGIISAVHLGRDAVALCGKEATPGQLRRLGISETEEFVICLDHGAEREAIELAEDLTSYGKDVQIRRYEWGDPADGASFYDDQFSWKYKIERILR